ncbi:MAG: universal stress protein [Desulfomonile tiedjei]|nr:universal stress protein [Desulfomonile tiedjei]
MLSRFIVATDLSPASFAIVRSLAGLKAFGARQCLLLSCLSLGESTAMALSLSHGVLESNLQKQKRILEEHGFVTRANTVFGFAKTEINRIAESQGYPLIVVGSHGRTLIGSDLLGGVASAVIHHATKPVLVIRLGVKEEEGEVRIQAGRGDFSRHILFPTDFSDNAKHAFTYLESAIADSASKVTLMHVQDKTRIDPHLTHRLEEFNEIDRARLEEMKKVLEARGNARIEIELSYGTPFAEIVRTVTERDVRLVMMGSQGRGFIKELFLGSVSHNVARHSEASVLLVPAKR